MKIKIKTVHLLLLLSFLASPLFSKDYKVHYFIGSVEVKKASSDDWAQIEIGMKIDNEDIIKTSMESRVELKNIRDGSILVIGERKNILVNEVLASSLEIINNKPKKGFWNYIKSVTSSSPTQGTSPTAVAAIRGKAAQGFEFVDANGDGINDNFIDEDNSVLSEDLSLLESGSISLIIRPTNREPHNAEKDRCDIRPDRCD